MNHHITDNWFSKVTASPNLLAAAPCTGLHIYLKLVPALFTFVLIVHTCISCFRYILYYIVHYSLYYFQRFVQRTIYFHLRTIIFMCFFLHILCAWHFMLLTVELTIIASRSLLALTQSNQIQMKYKYKGPASHC